MPGMGRKNRHKNRNAPKKSDFEATLAVIGLRAALEAEIQRFEDQVRREWHDKREYRQVGFVSLDFIANLFDPTKPPILRQSLVADAVTLDKEGNKWQVDRVEIEKLEEFVRTQASKLYSILQLVGQPQLIFRLYDMEHPLTDRIFEQGEHRDDVSYCSMAYLQGSKELCSFAEEIFEKQWCIPPVLSPELDSKFPVNWFRFPFADEPRHIGQGGYGQVFKVKIAHGHLDLPPSAGYDKGSVVAYKEVEKQTLIEEKVMREVRTIRARPHRNIVKFFASFSAGRETPWSEKDPRECLHMLFEHADAGNMQAWLKRSSAPETLADVSERRKHIMDSIESLVEAVTYIHSKIGVDIAFHHDLKPGNILRFKGPPATWKICDFGMANLKHHQETSGTTQNSANRFGSYDYQPPEYFDNDSPQHGRPFDVWSLGCIILELLTVWKHGWSEDGISRFFKLRGENDALDSTNRSRTHHSTPDYSFHNNRNVVKNWISHLRDLAEGEEADVKFDHLLELVTNMLEDRYQRIFIWEVHMDLHEMSYGADIDNLKNYFRRIAQESETSRNVLDNQHNPLKRAIEMKKEWQVDILQDKKWSVEKPLPAGNLNIQRHDKGVYYTTLNTCPHTREFEKNEFYGRHDMDMRITKGFNISNCVGLHGLSGMGKSHLAYHYVVRFQDTQSKEDRKHTFWVEAGTETRLHETVGNIARAIFLQVPTPEGFFPSVKRWLSDAAHGPWIMVIDGLDSCTVAAQLEHLLPQDSGQILVTTKNRNMLTGSLGNFLPQKWNEACLRVEQLSLGESRLLFQWYNDDILLNDSDMDNLLYNLSSPARIKLLAKYAAKTPTRTADLYEWMNVQRKGGKPIQFPPTMYKDLTKTYLIFEPLCVLQSESITIGNRLHKWPSKEFQLLGELSCMSKDEIDFQLVEQVYKNKLKLSKMLGSLENCSFITRGRSSATLRYCMHETVQDLTQKWVLDHMGLKYLLELYENVLIMLAFLYRQKTKSEANFAKIRRSSYLWKLPYMRHFERFLALAMEYSLRTPSDLWCSDNMVRSVLIFAQAYLDEGRYEDATCVLDFTRKLYKGTLYRPQLIRNLSKAYTVPPLSSRDESLWDKATTLLVDEIKQLKTQKTSNREQEWHCFIDLANLYGKVSRIDEATAALQELHEFTLVTKGSQPVIHAQNKRNGGMQTQDIHKLAILKCMAQARTYIAKAEQRARTQNLDKAKGGFVLAKSAIQQWFPNEDKWITKLDEAIAGVLEKINTPASIEEALKIYEQLLERIRSDFAAPSRSWSQTREWDLKCRVAHTQLCLDAIVDDVRDQAFETLTCALAYYEKVYPKRGAVHNEHTHICAHLLHEAYKRFGRRFEANEIEARFSLLPASCVRGEDIVYEDSQWVLKWALWGLFPIAILVFHVWTYS